MKNKEPALQDEVKHKTSDMAGTVLAKHPGTWTDETGEEITGNVLDVRGFNEKIYYATPAKNWEVVRENDE